MKGNNQMYDGRDMINSTFSEQLQVLLTTKCIMIQIWKEVLYRILSNLAQFMSISDHRKKERGNN